MSWHYLQEWEVGVSLVQDSGDIESSVLSRTMNTAARSCCNDNETSENTIRSGTTSEPSMDPLGVVGQWISSLHPFRANPSQLPDVTKDQLMTGTSGVRPRESLARYDPDTSSWRTYLPLFNTWEEYCPRIWPRSAMIVAGRLYQLDPQVPHISEIGGGVWPTPTASDHKGGTSAIRKDTGSPRKDRLDHILEPGESGKLNPDWVEFLMQWPTGWTSLDPLPEGTMEAWEASVKAGTYWDVDPADTGEVPRLTETRLHRAARLKAIGNGQVPAQLVLALQCLGGEA